MNPEAVRRTLEPTASAEDISGSTPYDAFVVSGVRLDAAEHGRVLCSFVVTPRIASPRGCLLSGVTATLADQLGSAVFYSSGVGLSGVSLEISVSYVDTATIGGFHLAQAEDQCTLLNGKPFTTKGAYSLLTTKDSDPHAQALWSSNAPSRVQIFGWLLHKDRLNTRKNLHHKTILDTPFCPRCPTLVEDKEHLFFSCPSAREVWTRAKINIQLHEFSDIWASPHGTNLPSSVWPTVALSILWKI